jgi:hypothetical protein
LKVSERHAQGMHMYKDDQGCVQTTWDDPIRGCKLFVRLCHNQIHVYIYIYTNFCKRRHTDVAEYIEK